MAYTRVQNSGHFLARLAWLRHLGLTGVCADCNNKISYKKYNYKCAVMKISENHHIDGPGASNHHIEVSCYR